MNKRRKRPNGDSIPSEYEERLYRPIRALFRSYWVKYLKPFYQAQAARELGVQGKSIGTDEPVTWTPIELHEDPDVKRFIAAFEGIMDQAAHVAQVTYGLKPADDYWTIRNQNVYEQIQTGLLDLCDETLDEMAQATGKRFLELARDVRKENLGRQQSGQTLLEFTGRLEKYFREEAAWRARRIAHTESARANNYGFYHGTAGFDEVIGYEWVLSADACAICHRVGTDADGRPAQVAKGTLFAIQNKGNPAYRNIVVPPAHPNCFLGETPVMAPGLVAALTAQYKGRLVRITTTDGSEFTVTPNHMILTSTGWAFAQNLVQGDSIIRAAGVEINPAAPTFDSPDNQHGITLAQDIFRSVSESGFMPSVGVPPAPEYLHGDAAGVDKEIQIVRADRKLAHEIDTLIYEKLAKLGLVTIRDAGPGLARSSPFNEFFGACLAATDGLVGRGRELAAFARGKTVHTDNVCLGTGSNREAKFVQPSNDTATGDAKILRHLQNAISGQVCTSQVVQVDIFTVHEPIPVYDFQTSSGLTIIGNGLVSSNCRCSVVAVTNIDESWFQDTVILEGGKFEPKPPARPTAPPKLDLDAEIARLEQLTKVKPSTAKPRKPRAAKPKVPKPGEPTGEETGSRAADRLNARFQALMEAKKQAGEFFGDYFDSALDTMKTGYAMGEKLTWAGVKKFLNHDYLNQKYQGVQEWAKIREKENKAFWKEFEDLETRANYSEWDYNDDPIYYNGNKLTLREAKEYVEELRTAKLKEDREQAFRMLRVADDQRATLVTDRDGTDLTQAEKNAMVPPSRENQAVFDTAASLIAPTVGVRKNNQNSKHSTYQYDEAVVWTSFETKNPHPGNWLANCQFGGWGCQFNTKYKTQTEYTAAHELGHSLAAGNNAREKRNTGGKWSGNYYGSQNQPLQWTLAPAFKTQAKNVKEETLEKLTREKGGVGMRLRAAKFKFNEYAGGKEKGVEVPSVFLEFFYQYPVEFVQNMPPEFSKLVLGMLDGSIR